MQVNIINALFTRPAHFAQLIMPDAFVADQFCLYLSLGRHHVGNLLHDAANLHSIVAVSIHSSPFFAFGS